MTDKRTSLARRNVLRLAIGAAVAGSAGRVLAATPKSDALSLNHLDTGKTRTIHVDGYPILLLRRDAGMISALKQQTANLADPDSQHSQQPAYAKNPWRSRDPEFLVMVNHCTFDGCPIAFGGCPSSCGFACPCCGSQYDAAGRVQKFQPAPRNLAIPYYRIDRKQQSVIIERVEKVRTVE
ncbi:ubiquinol-cytochrome c reductase iron-sulfur subunit [Acidihalobacter ferrooxydans]|uniref:Ubiquinol-cytochrome c reductase iron-sulfur subunit n=1 Tax=Acidihalobacter ferrooxydans TaxID=1765967 RepID=A0A1P8UEX7_9GAMM|nr:ubiquinol-cytochrome c reductase iron-sulfur subunit [Acidihalobacter ferrooxydans]APZ42359.1 ubiquinol-cytochrome c reductase iron-sulfur subunit [Acidihalobacter ferrooxydans]